MAEYVNVLVAGEHYQYKPQKYAVYGSPTFDRNKQLQVTEAVRLANALINMFPMVHGIFQDIMHRIFRLGKLGGLKGDAYRCYADQIGEAIRKAQGQLLYGIMCRNLNLFRDMDEMNFIHPLKPQNEVGLNFLDPYLYVDWDGSMTDEIPPGGRSVFGHDDEIKSVFPYYQIQSFFSPLVKPQMGSFYDRLVEIAVFTFGDEHSFERHDEIRHYQPYESDKAELFVAGAKRIIVEPIYNLIELWTLQNLVVPCDKCGHERPKADFIAIDDYQLFRMEDNRNETFCPKCDSMGLVFTDKVKTTRGEGAESIYHPDVRKIRLPGYGVPEPMGEPPENVEAE